jgi:hypothetical protein
MQTLDHESHIPIIAKLVENDTDIAAIEILKRLLNEYMDKNLTPFYINRNADLISRAFDLCAKRFAIIENHSDCDSFLLPVASMLRDLMKFDLAECDIRNLHIIYIKMIHAAEFCDIYGIVGSGRISHMMRDFEFALTLPIKYEDGCDVLFDVNNSTRKSAKYIVEQQYPDGTYGAAVAKKVYAQNYKICFDILYSSTQIIPHADKTKYDQYINNLADSCGKSSLLPAIKYLFTIKIVTMPQLVYLVENAIPIAAIDLAQLLLNCAEDDIIAMLNEVEFDKSRLTKTAKINIRFMAITICTIIARTNNEELRVANDAFCKKYLAE